MFIAGADLKELGSVKPRSGRRPQARSQRGLEHHRPRSRSCRSRPSPSSTAPAWAAASKLALGFDYRLAGIASEDRDRPARSQDRPDPRLGRHPTPAAPHRPEPGRRDDLRRRDRQGRKGPCSSASSSTSCPSDNCSTKAGGCWPGRATSGDLARRSRRKKQQPVGLSRGATAFTFAVAKAMVLAKTKGQFPAPLAALDAIAKGCNLPLEEGLKVETEPSSRWSAAPFRAT